MKYNDFKKLFNTNFKKEWMDKCDIVFRSEGIRLGIYKKHKKYLNYGIIDKYGRWCWRNTINTHPNAALSLYNYYLKFGNPKLNFFENRTESINLIFDFIKKNFELLFTENITSEYFRVFELLTNKSWSKGQITTISFFLCCKYFFPDVDFYEYTLERGDPDDFNGIDGKLHMKSGQIETVQIKSGESTSALVGSYYIVKGAVNYLKSKSDYYCYVCVDTDITYILVFNNYPTKMIFSVDQILVEKELIINKKQTNLMITQTLMEILKLCAKNNFVFDLKNDEPLQYFLIEENKVTISIPNFEDESLEPMLLENFENLKKTLH